MQPYHGEGRLIVRDLTKTYGHVRAVDQLSFTVEPGSVTGFLGPNGAGKTTTLRAALGLIRPTSGSVTFDGVPYPRLSRPLQVVGAALDATSFHPARTGRNHLLVLCAAAELPDQRADVVLDLVGLTSAARRKVRSYSLGMRQRLALAAALLGNPRILFLDEPTNGLDPEGIRWLRDLLRHLADDGRTVLVSSHQLGEVEAVADRAVILDRGRLVRAGTLSELTACTATVLVRTPQANLLAAAVPDHVVDRPDPSTLRLRDLPAPRIGEIAHRAGIELHQLSTEHLDLEQLFFTLTHGEHAGKDLR